MSKILVIGAGGVSSVAIHKMAQLSNDFKEITLASRTIDNCKKIQKQIKKKYNCNIVIRVTADDILIDPYYLDKLISFHLKNNLEYSNTRFNIAIKKDKYDPYKINMNKKNKKVNAAILIIGDEILSGRTQDLNVSFLSNWLNESCGISVREVRVISDIEKNIIKTFNLLKNPYSKFRVACSIIMKDNTFIKGVNVENKSYGLTICAERNAMTSLIS